MAADHSLGDPFVIVLPACNRDCQILLRNLDWMRVMDGRLPYAALVHQDSAMNTHLARQVFEAACAVFSEVTVNRYATPTDARWPAAPNCAFQNAAWHMYETVGRPWFWMEPDLVPVKPGWCKALQDEYKRCGKPIMGSVVDHHYHLNGTAIYPPDFPEISPAAMEATTVAWDWVMKDDTMPLAHCANHLMYHCWGIQNGKPHPFLGPAASFSTQALVDAWVPAGAVTFHRCKDASLIQRLLERRNAH